MSLSEYNKKRKLNNTPEPAGGRSTANKLQFVVQKHSASHLHYDFRLEMKGVLKSWAVPKGPSLDPAVRRSAFMVEDHPFDYKDFEGNIPKGNYGAGPVIIWDQGTFEPVQKKKTKAEQESHLLHHLHMGSIEFILHGKRLKGRFRLTHVPEHGENNWLLVKLKDGYATKKDVLQQDTSVISGLTVEAMKENSSAATWKSNRSSKETVIEKTRRQLSASTKKLLKKAKKAAMPAKVTPMSATLIQKPFDDEDWLYELKFDGYRIISYLKGDDVLLHTKGFLNYTGTFQEVSDALRELQLNAVLDGEVIAANKEGKPDFQALQQKRPSLPLQYYVFDILWLDGYDLTHLALMERKAILKEVLIAGDVIKYSDDFTEGVSLFEGVKQMGLEGIIGKKKTSIYLHKRTKDWIKVKAVTELDVVLIAWSESETPKTIRSLFFGYYDGRQLKYFGHTGHGLNKSNLPLIMSEVKRLATTKKPVKEVVDSKTKIHWLKAERVIRIRIDDITESGQIRKPATFIGFRDDIVPEDVGNPVAELNTVAAGKHSATSSSPLKAKVKSELSKQNEESNWSVLDKQAIQRRDTLEIEGSEIELTNIDRGYWGELTKGDLINYYIRIAPYILPHLENRPLSLHIKNIAPAAPGLYIKDMEGRQPAYASIHSTPRLHAKKGRRHQIDYLVCNNLATLVYAVNLGCIDFNPWVSTVQTETEPDYIIIDLDPSDDDFEKVITTSLAAKQVLDEHKLKAFIKTSGKTGMHICVPCTGFVNRNADNDNPTYNPVRLLGERLCKMIHELVPAISTINVSKSSRGDKVFVDFSQNDYADTIASAYSARPHRKPTVSTPLDWKEVKKGLSPNDFTILNIEARVQKKGDLFLGLYDKRIATKNSKVLKGLL
jgi:bifunctional non-homologous end joining protein LigD